MKSINDLKTEFKQRALDFNLRVQCPMDGDFNAEMAIVAQGPGQSEVNAEKPFVGESGRLLWNALRPFKFLRTHFYITNVVKRQVSVAKNARNPVLADEMLKWKALVQWELSQLPNLKYVLVMGNYALEACLGETGITKFRGSVYERDGKTFVCAFNPADILRNPQDEIMLLMDIRRFTSVVNGDHIPYDITKHINPTFSQAREWIHKMKNEEPPVSFDIETPSYHTGCWGLANEGHEAMCINLRDGVHNRFTVDEEITLMNDLQDMLDIKKIIAQNGNFDAHWIGYKDLIRCRVWFDTMLAHHTLYSLLPHDLGFLTSQYTTHPFYKDDGKDYKEGGDVDGYWRYNATDAAITWECHRKLLKELQEQKLDDFFFNHVMALDPHLVRSTVDGMAVDISVQHEIAEAMEQDVRKIEKEFQNLVLKRFDDPYYEPNIRSPKQMKELFLDRLKLRTTKNTIDKTAREKLIDDPRTSQDAKDLLIKYNEYQQEHKFFSTYAKMKVDEDERFRTVWKQQGVTKAPGRLSSSGNLWGTASNAQNQPTRSRKFFTADEGTVIFYGDGSQAEARVVAYLADIDKWKEDFERARVTGDFDAHRSLAADMYKIPYDEIPKEDWVVDPETGLEIPTIRYKAKRARHGLNYRMQFPRLAEAAKLSLFEAKRTFILYHNTNPEIKKWWNELEKIAKTKRELWTPFGRRLKIIQRIDENALESVVAFVPQSTVGDLLKKVWRQCHEDDEWDDSKMRIKLNVHDALIGISTPEKAKTALKIMKKYTETPILIENVYKTKVEELIIPMDVAISQPDEKGIHRWSTLEKVKL